MTTNLNEHNVQRTKAHTANRRLAKKRVQCLNEVLSFVSSSVLADRLVLRNPLLRQAPKRCASFIRNHQQDTNKQLEIEI